MFHFGTGAKKLEKGILSSASEGVEWDRDRQHEASAELAADMPH
jgi:hypothetical protein